MESQGKICPQCNQEASAEHQVCPFDGVTLLDQSIDHYCSTCGKYYSNEMQSCPVHGVELTPITLPPEGLEGESDGEVEVLDEKAVDDFLRELCPKCGAWRNWEKLGFEYTCQSCMVSFRYQDGQLTVFKSKTTFQIESERLETLPSAPVLSAIDKDNKRHWLRKFEKFDSSPGYRNWNWPSFFFGPYRYFWKGMWKKGLLIYGVLVCIEIALMFLAPTMPSYSANPLSSGGDQGPLAVVVGLLIKVYLGNVGSRDYHKFVNSFDGEVSKAKSALTIGRVLFILTVALDILGRVLGGL